MTNSLKTPRELQLAYPHQFEKLMPYSYVPTGWISVFAELCQAVQTIADEAKMAPPQWRQCKEKFGSARWYFDLVGHRSQAVRLSVSQPAADGLRLDVIEEFTLTSTKIRKPRITKKELAAQLICTGIEASQSLCGHLCEVCGADGEIASRGGWYRCLCARHGALKSPPSSSFDEADQFVFKEARHGF